MKINIKKSINVCCAIRSINKTELAEKAGMGQPQLAHIMKKNSCTVDTIDKLAKALDYTPAEFIAKGE